MDCISVRVYLFEVMHLDMTSVLVRAQKLSKLLCENGYDCVTPHQDYAFHAIWDVVLKSVAKCLQGFQCIFCAIQSFFLVPLYLFLLKISGF